MANKMTEFAAYEAAEHVLQLIADASTADERPELPSIDRRTKFIADRILKADPDLAPPHLMASLEANLKPAGDHVANYISSNNAQHVRQAIDVLGKATQLAMGLPLLESAGQADSWFSEILVNARQAANAGVTEVRSKADDLGKRLGSLETAQGEVQDSIKQAKERTDKVISDFQEQFSQNENSRNERFEKRTEELRKQIQETLDILNTEAASAREELDKDADSLLERMRERDKETLRLAHVMGATGVSANFQATANTNQRAADWLRILAIGLFIVMVGTVMLAVWMMHTAGTDITIVRLLTALVFAIPATYAARESTRQRAEAVRSRRLETELAALGPFIETLSDEKKAALREKLVEAYFGKSPDNSEHEPDSVVFGGSVMDLLKWVKEVTK